MSTTEFKVGDEVKEDSNGGLCTILCIVDQDRVVVHCHITTCNYILHPQRFKLHRSFKSILVGEVGEDIVPDLHYDRVQVEEEIRVNLLKLIYLKEREDV